MNKNIELDTKILNKNLEITKLTKQLDNLTSDSVDLKEKLNEFKLNPSDTRFKDKPFNNDDNVNLLKLLNEIHERMYKIMEYCERLQPVKLGMNEDWKVGTVDISRINLTDKEEMLKTKLFRLQDLDEMTNFDDQTTRSILEDLRKVIKYLEKDE